MALPSKTEIALVAWVVRWFMLKPTVVLGRFLGGKPLSGQYKTDATWFSRGTELLDGAHAMGQWAYRPGWQRFLVRWGAMGATVATLAGLAYAPILTTVAVVAALGAWVALLVRRALRSHQARQHHRTVVVPLAEALRTLLPEWDHAARLAALTVPAEPSEDDPVRIMLPNSFEGTDAQKAGISGLVSRRLGGSWDGAWQLHAAPFYVEFTPRKAKPQLPKRVDWIPSDDPHTVMIGVGHHGPIWVKTETETPHWGVTAGTGGGKTTSLLLPLMHNRLHGALVDVIDLKEDSFDEAADGVSGVRIHRDAISAVMCLAEFFTSMKSIRTARIEGYSEPIPNRILVLDEFGSFMLAAQTWWKYGLNGKGTPPFLAWFRMALMQGRTKNHRMVFGVHQFSLDIFGSTDARDLVGAKVVIGPCSGPKWVTSFGQGTHKPDWDESIPGRGVVGITGKGGGIQEVQMCYFTMSEAREMLESCDPAPEWFDRGEMAPWITPAGVKAADAEGSVRGFLPGGEHVTDVTALSSHASSPSLDPVTDVTVTRAVTPELGAGQLAIEAAPRASLRLVPEMYTLREAAEAGIVPLSYDALRQRKKRAAKLGVEFPEGVSFGSVTQYSEAELRDWWDRVQSAGGGSAQESAG